MTRRTQLVTQYLEKVSRKVLEKHQDIVRDYVFRRQGIYALYRKEKLYYVGLATNLRGRLRSHLRDRHGASWDRFSVYLTLHSSQLKELESLALRIVMPAGNRQTGKFYRAEDLQKKFRNDIRSRLEEELDGLIPRKGMKVKKKRKKAKVKKISKKTGKVPTLAKYITKQLRIMAVFEGRKVRALVLKDGSIRLAGEIYNSPSWAGRTVRKGRCNGWKFWKYQRAPGDWVSLDELRK